MTGQETTEMQFRFFLPTSPFRFFNLLPPSKVAFFHFFFVLSRTKLYIVGSNCIRYGDHMGQRRRMERKIKLREEALSEAINFRDFPPIRLTVCCECERLPDRIYFMHATAKVSYSSPPTWNMSERLHGGRIDSLHIQNDLANDIG